MPVESVPEIVTPKGWTIDKRQAIGAALGLVCLGIIVGFKLGSGSEPMVLERPVFVEKPCADCEEEKAQARGRHPTSIDPQQSVPGDSSVPED